MTKELIDKLKEFLNSGNKLLDETFCEMESDPVNELFLKKFDFSYKTKYEEYEADFEFYYKGKIIYTDGCCSCTGFEFNKYNGRYDNYAWTIRDFIVKGLGVE